MTDERIAELRRLAEAARKGPWTLTHVRGCGQIQEFDVRGAFGNSANTYPIFNRGSDAIEGATVFCDPRDITYITAASPDVILSLLAGLDALTLQRDNYKTVAEGMRRENEALRKDASRYRWLRDQIKYGGLLIAESAGWELVSWSGDDPDREIDAALSRGSEGL